MNKLLKSLNKLKEAPVDVVILSFLRLHQYYVKEISRGRAGLGNYNLRPQYISAKLDLSEIYVSYMFLFNFKVNILQKCQQ